MEKEIRHDTATALRRQSSQRECQDKTKYKPKEPSEWSKQSKEVWRAGLSKRPSWKSNDENKFESHKQNQTNKWWQSAGFLVRTQIRLPLLTIEFLLVRSPKGALQKWRLGWSDKLTGFPRDETLFAVVFLLSKLCSICIRLISKRIV